MASPSSPSSSRRNATSESHHSAAGSAERRAARQGRSAAWPVHCVVGQPNLFPDESRKFRCSPTLPGSHHELSPCRWAEDSITCLLDILEGSAGEKRRYHVERMSGAILR